jgi:aminoglycoside phosphotransferase (APT) family kinase protein
MGEAQRGLHEVEAPPEVTAALEDDSHPFGAGRDVTGLPDGNRLLHLDWHPLNLLVDERDRLVGIIDWDNARRGHPLLDLARTESLLTADPALESLPRALHGRLARFRDAWAEGYGDEARRILAVARRWASRVMLDDLAPKHADAPEMLRGIREWGNASEQAGD